MATADVAAAGWDRERIASQLHPLLSLWQTITSSNSALKAVSHGVSTGCLSAELALRALTLVGRPPRQALSIYAETCWRLTT